MGHHGGARARGGTGVTRTAREVFDDHLHIGVEGTVEEDIDRNYASTS